MVGSDLKVVLGKLPGYCQETSSGAVIDSKRLALELKRVPSRVACCPFDQVRVGLRINGGQSHPSNVMQNAGSIGEIAVDRVPSGNSFRDHRAGNAVTPTSPQSRCERFLHVRSKAHRYDYSSQAPEPEQHRGLQNARDFLGKSDQW